MLLRLVPPLAPIAGLALLAACATVPPPAIEAAPAAAVAPPPPPGLELLLQKPPETAIALLGKPRLDKQEGISRQLQFEGDCILDVWYYPGASGPVASYADARLDDGRDVAAGACLRQLLPGKGDAARPPAAGQ